MIDYLIKLNSSIKNKNRFLSKVKFYGLQRLIIKIFANLYIPSYFRISNINYKRSHRLKKDNSDKLIVSLTSFPARIGRLWLVIECILRQTHKPDKIILWLSKEQFPNYEALPKRLLEQRERGLEIYLCDDDLRSHKKYYYTIKNFPDSSFITIDDDVFYPSSFIKNLIDYKKQYKHSIITNRSHKITHTLNKVDPYISWERLVGEHINCFDIVPVGVGGVLYFPGALHPMAIEKEVFMENCSSADDLWLFFMAHINDVPFTKTKYDVSLIPIMNMKNETLSSHNVTKSFNDFQFDRTHVTLKGIFNRKILKFLQEE